MTDYNIQLLAIVVINLQYSLNLSEILIPDELCLFDQANPRWYVCCPHAQANQSWSRKHNIWVKCQFCKIRTDCIKNICVTAQFYWHCLFIISSPVLCIKYYFDFCDMCLIFEESCFFLLLLPLLLLFLQLVEIFHQL